MNVYSPQAAGFTYARQFRRILDPPWRDGLLNWPVINQSRSQDFDNCLASAYRTSELLVYTVMGSD